MKCLLCLLFVFTCCTSMLAQKKTVVTVKAGNNIMDVLPHDEIFLYPEFSNARVFLRNGVVSEVKLNYNRLVDEMHFIDQKGDTLALDSEQNVRFVVVGNDTFLYDRGYMKIVSSRQVVKLAIKDIWVISETRQVGAYGATNTSVSMLSFKTMNQDGRLYDLVVNEDIILKKQAKYYLGNSFYDFVIASKTNLLMLFPKEEQRISKFLKENKINFNNKSDLEKTVQFIAQLSLN